MYSLPPSTEVRRPLPKAQLYKKFELKQSQRDAIDADIARMDFVNMIAPQTVPSIAAGNEVKAVFVVEVELKRKEYDERSIAMIAKLIPQQIIFALRHGDKVKLAVYYTKLFVTAWHQAEGASIWLDGLNLDTVWENQVRTIGNIGTIDSNRTIDSNDTIGTTVNVGTCLRHVEQQSLAHDNTGSSHLSSSALKHAEGMSLRQQTTLSSALKHAEGMSLRDEIKADEERAKLQHQITALQRQMAATKQPRRKRELFLQIQKLKQIAR
ncbi:MAG: DUF4391 domain-containing protein [Muribaculum sp.]|nr:DUF4391 domain-containing protein [Muribaculum sp.]